MKESSLGEFGEFLVGLIKAFKGGEAAHLNQELHSRGFDCRGWNDELAVVQYDIKTNKRKVVAFLSKFYKEKYGYSPDGTFSTAVSPDGSIVYVTWNGSRAPDAKDWDTVAMTAIHIPKSERKP